MSKIPKTLSNEESAKLIEQVSWHTATPASKRKAARNRLLGLLMLEAGLRVGELSKLKIQNLIYATRPVTNLVLSKEITKRNRERTVPLSERIQKAIAENYDNFWIGHAPHILCWAFCGSKYSQHITCRQIERIINRAGQIALGKSVNPHMLRHTFASRLMRITNIRVVQELLGHTNIQTTQIYMHPNTDDLNKAINGLTNAETQTKEKALQDAESNLANS